ncbi:DUF5067 domain-containing protein [Planomicrobium sp. MB-3u-38]|uniref:DUF5067 domain-containing protein n=1 Tax=Planomicrobium sp. MB-3u-38 TaxID=2058318 RepID=UPI0013043B6B|nr:DUF5067 domain-containing protein [Planomicrobium sp. MB-3u-38]
MKKISLVLLSAIWVLSACSSDATTETTEEAVSKTETNVVDEKSKSYNMSSMEYSIPESWNEEVSGENLKYYYPEDGMLMVSHDEIDGTISDDVTRASFIDGVTSSFDSFDLISESEIAVAGTTAYQYNFDIVLSNEEYKTSLITFDHYDGINSLMMATVSNSEKDYSSEFENILSSIEFTDEANKEVEEKAVEESIGNQIVLGEPIELGEYTLTIQKYSLGIDYEGNNALIVEYDWVNNSEDSTSPFMTFMLKGFQDDVETDDVIMVEGVDLGIGQKEVRPGGLIEGAQSTVGISDITKPLELELDELFSFNGTPYIAEIDLSTLE